jgi:sucrose-6-phosphate hydrolase SacC (GH32 family)
MVREGSLALHARLFKSTDFVSWNHSHRFHENPTTGMWECPDFLPVRAKGTTGLDPSTIGRHVLNVLKVTSDLYRKPETEKTWTQIAVQARRGGASIQASFRGGNLALEGFFRKD